MSEEEIKRLQLLLVSKNNPLDIEEYKIILKLYDLYNKQKEIVKKYENYTRLRSVVDFYNKNPKNEFISKDKIKEKIELIKNLNEKIYYEENVISILQDLLK